jgi:hypothetical protein
MLCFRTKLLTLRQPNRHDGVHRYIRRQLKRRRFLPFFQNQPPCLVGIDYWGRRIPDDGAGMVCDPALGSEADHLSR